MAIREQGPVGRALRAQRPLIAAALLASGAISVFSLTTSLYMLAVFDRVLTSRSEATLGLLTLIALGGLMVGGTLDALRRRLLVRVAVRVGATLANPVLQAMVATNSQVGGTAFRSGLRDVETLRTFIGSSTCAALLDVPFLLVYLVVLALLSPWYLLVVVVGSAVLVAIAFAGDRLTSRPLTRAMSGSQRAQTFAEDGVRNADVLEGMGMSPTFVARWRALWNGAMRTNVAALDSEARLAALSKTVRLMIQVALMATGAMLILDLHATGGVMIGATIIGSRAVSPIEVLISSWKNIVGLRLVRARLGDLMSGAPARHEGMPLPAPSGEVRVVGASYIVAATRRTVLANVTFGLDPGEALGIIGPSASGKSTLARVLVGAWPCSTGVVRLDGANIYAWPRAALGPHIGYLPQDVELFAGTVRDNIARMDAGDPERVVRAAELAGAHDMILSLPFGYDTEIGDAGHWLSGGQRQRIGLARALYGGPQFVVLDEPNANLDGAGEAALVETLAALKRLGVTVVVVAHRPSVLTGMDKILVLKPGGGMAAFGPRSEVLSHFLAPVATGRPDSGFAAVSATG